MIAVMRLASAHARPDVSKSVSTMNARPPGRSTRAISAVRIRIGNVFEHLCADRKIQSPRIDRQSHCVTHSSSTASLALLLVRSGSDLRYVYTDHLAGRAYHRGHHLAEEPRSAADVDHPLAALEIEPLQRRVALPYQVGAR